MLKLSKDDRRQLREALTSGYRNYDSLKIFVSDNLDLRLNEFASSRALKVAAEDLIEYIEERRDLSDLILALAQDRPRNPEVQYLLNRLQVFLREGLCLDPRVADMAALAFELPAPYEDRQLESFLPRPLSYETDVGQLRRGLQLANGVCKVSFTDRATTGTGVLIGADLILTNYHVLSGQVVEDLSALAEKAKTLQFEFGFVSEEHETPVSPDSFAVDLTQPVVAFSPPTQLDYVLLRVESKIVGFEYIKPIGISTTAAFPKEGGLNVLQHPEGNVMQVSLSASGIVQADAGRHRVWYVNRTEGGSSGSPCFNCYWELVALHHASMARGFGSIREGILFSSILAEISDFLM